MVLHGNDIKGFYLPTIGYSIKIEIAYLLGKIRNNLPIRIASFKTNLISNSKAPISSAYFISEGILNNLKTTDLTEQDAKRIHPHSLSSLNSAIKLYNKIASIKFYLDSSTIEMTEKLIDNYYEIEFIIRGFAYQNEPIDKGDEVLNKVASAFSQHSLYSLNEI